MYEEISAPSEDNVEALIELLKATDPELLKQNSQKSKLSRKKNANDCCPFWYAQMQEKACACDLYRGEVVA